MTKVQINSQGKVYVANGKALIATEGITPSGTLNITQNGTYDVTNYASADVNVSSGSGIGDCLFAWVNYSDLTGSDVVVYTKSEEPQENDYVIMCKDGLLTNKYHSGAGAHTMKVISYNDDGSISVEIGINEIYDFEGIGDSVYI